MNDVYVKLRQRKSNKYRKILSIEEDLYPSKEELITSTVNYSPETELNEGDWYCIQQASTQQYAVDWFSSDYNTVDFELLRKEEYEKVDYIVVKNDTNLCFQNVSKTRCISKKRIAYIGEKYRYEGESRSITINNIPDAIYSQEEDRLYFRKLESITGIFKGIDQLYKEATKEEIEGFLGNDFISLYNDYSEEDVKKANRKRIALALKTLSSLDEDDRESIFKYIEEYCPELEKEDNKFKIGTEDELKLLLYGIEQRFYTTSVTKEKRIANSVITLT